MAFDLLSRLIRTKGFEEPGNLYGPSVPEKDWREAFYDALRHEADQLGREAPGRKVMQKAFKRALDRLADHGLVMVANERVCILRYM